MDGIKAGSLRRNKSEGERTQGPGFICIVSGPRASRRRLFSDTSCKQHLDRVADVFAELQWLLEEEGWPAFYFIFRASPRPNPLVLSVLLLFVSQGCSRPFFCALQRGNKLVSWHGYFDWRYTLATCLWKQCQSTTWLNCHIGSPGRGLW